MAKYMLIYRGDATDPADMTQDQRDAEMALWAKWMEGVGSAMVDMGTPFGAGAAVVDDGSSGSAVSSSGYTVIEAASMDDARSMCQEHPYLREGKGNYAIDIYEMLPVPM